MAKTPRDFAAIGSWRPRGSCGISRRVSSRSALSIGGRCLHGRKLSAPDPARVGSVLAALDEQDEECPGGTSRLGGRGSGGEPELHWTLARAMIARSPEELVGEQFRRRQLRWGGEQEPPRRLAVALSRLAGARGDEVARRLSASLGYDLFDREIIQQIARDVRLSERVVSALDERDRSFLTDWLESFAAPSHLSTYEYLHHLRIAVGGIARLGAAVIVGRGAHLILGPSEALRVLVVAPRDVRVATVAAERGLSLREARRRVEVEEAERRAFLQKHFQAQLEDPEAFDLVVNTHVLGVEGAVEAIKGSLSSVTAAASPLEPAGAPADPSSWSIHQACVETRAVRYAGLLRGRGEHPGFLKVADAGSTRDWSSRTLFTGRRRDPQRFPQGSGRPSRPVTLHRETVALLLAHRWPGSCIVSAQRGGAR